MQIIQREKIVVLLEKKSHFSWAWWGPPVIPVLRRMRETIYILFAFEIENPFVFSHQPCMYPQILWLRLRDNGTCSSKFTFIVKWYLRLESPRTDVTLYSREVNE